MKSNIKKVFFWLFVGFVALFIFRFIYGYTKTVPSYSGQTQFFDSVSSSKRNYASKEYKVKTTSTNASAVKVDQKYEKIAEIKTKSTKFESDEASSRQSIVNYDALIQFEQKSGNKGHRSLNLLIGVPPENFDSLYNELIQIGIVKAKQITKKDKTNEYKELNAKKKSLEKIRTSLIELKSKGGKIDEYMGLENRILEIETQLQGLGVSLGDFDDENEFCTVQFSMVEGKVVSISTIHRVKVALEWTIKIYLRFMMMLAFMGIVAYVILLIVDRLKIISRIMNR